MRFLRFLMILASLIVSGSRSALALDMEYYTYNGFDAIMTAWMQSSMVFINGEYATLFFSVIFASMIFGAVAGYYKLFRGSNVHPLAWAVPIGFGVVIYLGAFVPRATLHIYDPVLNRYQPVNDLPQGVVFLAGSFNLVERGIVEIIEMSGAPLSYKEYAGGIGFDSLLKASGNISMNDKYIESSTSRYITDCMYFELNRPGSTLKLSDLMSNNGTLLTLFGEAASPSIFTVWYDGANQSGTDVTCFDAYINLNAYFSDPVKMDSLVRSRCAGAGFNPDDANEKTRCKQALESTILYATGNSVGTEKFFQQVVLAQQMSYAATRGGIDESIKIKGNINTMSSMYGAGIQANEWIPLIRAIVTAVAIGLLPVLVIFIPTGIGHKALAMIAGFFIWLMFWGVTDAIIHQLANKYAYKFFEQARQNGIGYASIMAMPDAAAKSLALFGLIRSMGMGLATAITIKIANFIDAHSLSQVGGQLSGSVQGQGAEAGKIATPEGTADAIKGPVVASATMANAQKYDYEQRTAAATFEQNTSTGSSLGNIDHLGNGNIHQATDRSVGANVTDRSESVNRAEGKGGPGAAAVIGRQGGEQALGAALQDARMSNALGINQQELGEFRQHGVVTDKMAPSIGASLGLSPEQSRRELSGMQVNPRSLSVNQETGALMLTHGELQSADGSKTLGHGMITKSGMKSGQQILDEASQLKKLGHSEAAEGLMKMVNPNVTSSDGKMHGMAEKGRGLLANETAKFTEQTSYDGKFGTMSMEHGSAVSWYDTSSDKQGRSVRRGDDTHIGDSTKLGDDYKKGDTVRVGDDVDKGDHTKEGSTYTAADGSFYQGAAQMAMDGNPLLVSQISKPGLSEQERDTERLQVAGAVAGDMAAFIRRSGRSEDYSRAEGSAGAGIPGTKIGGSLSAGYQTTDAYDANLGTQRYNEVMKEAGSEAATHKDWSKADVDSFTSQKLKDAVQVDKKYFEEHGKWSYGATGMAGRVANKLKGDQGEGGGMLD